MEMNDVRGVWNQTFNSAGLAGQTAGITTYTTTATGGHSGCDYTIGGRHYYSVNDGATATPTADITTGDAFVALSATTAATATGCVFVYCWDSSQVLRVAQGPIVTVSDVTNKSAVYEFPSIPDTVTPFAYQTITFYGATPWIFGTGNWDASTVSLGTVVNCSILPTQPLTAASA